MSAKPWMTSNTLIASVKRKISFPAAQATFTDDEILAFANEEMLISQVPSVMQFHEEYFVHIKTVPLINNVTNYPIPDRAIGMKLRDLFWTDAQGNLYEMTKISSEDKAFFQRNSGTNQSVHKYYLQNNDVILTPSNSGSTGRLSFDYFLRPNQLVKDERAAVMNSFGQTITIDISTMVPGDYVAIKGNSFTAVASGAIANQFNIGVDSITTATNLVSSINTAAIGVTASNSATNIVTLNFLDMSFAISVPDPMLPYQIVSNIVTNNTAAFTIPSTVFINFDSIPDIFSTGNLVDFLETRPGHKIKTYDIVLQSVSGNSMFFNLVDIPTGIANDDYICLAYECIIPNIPPDLHNGLAERTGARILAALGDQQGLAASNAKIQEINGSQGTLLDSRVDGSPSKITARHSLLRYGKPGLRRRY